MCTNLFSITVFYDQNQFWSHNLKLKMKLLDSSLVHLPLSLTELYFLSNDNIHSVIVIIIKIIFNNNSIPRPSNFYFLKI